VIATDQAHPTELTGAVQAQPGSVAGVWLVSLQALHSRDFALSDGCDKHAPGAARVGCEGVADSDQLTDPEGWRLRASWDNVKNPPQQRPRGVAARCLALYPR
jgi:hypothetical protein